MMRKPSGCGRVLLLLIPSVLFLLPLGTITFALERISNGLVLDQTRDDGLIPGQTFNEASTDAILGICVLVDIVSILDVFGIWELRRIEGTARHQRKWVWIILISSIAMVVASAGVMGYATSVQNSEAESLSKGEDRISFTRETWACTLKDADRSQSWAIAACGLEKTARFLLIAISVSSTLVLVSLWILLRDRGGLRWLFGGKGRHAESDNTHKLGPTSAGALSAQPQ